MSAFAAAISRIFRANKRGDVSAVARTVTARHLGPAASLSKCPEMDGDADITGLLRAWRAGDGRAFDALLTLVYEELRRVARGQLGRERRGHTLSTTAVVHEAYFKLADQKRVQWADRSHFFAVATQAMRRILVDYARRYRAEKRGGALERVSLSEAMLVEERADNLIALDEALCELAGVDSRLSSVVECRFFGGLTEEETAEVLGVTARTVRRDWTRAKGWLNQALR